MNFVSSIARAWLRAANNPKARPEKPILPPLDIPAVPATVSSASIELRAHPDDHIRVIAEVYWALSDEISAGHFITTALSWVDAWEQAARLLASMHVEVPEFSNDLWLRTPSNPFTIQWHKN